jgi:hypothetical protein
MRQKEDHMKRQELLREEETNGGCGAAGRDDEVRERSTSRVEASSRGDVHARSSRASVWHRAERRVAAEQMCSIEQSIEQRARSIRAEQFTSEQKEHRRVGLAQHIRLDGCKKSVDVSERPIG